MSDGHETLRKFIEAFAIESSRALPDRPKSISIPFPVAEKLNRAFIDIIDNHADPRYALDILIANRPPDRIGAQERKYATQRVARLVSQGISASEASRIVASELEDIGIVKSAATVRDWYNKRKTDE